MKTIQILLIALLLSFGAKAQDPYYNGPAEREVKSFWINAMGIQKTGKVAEGVAMLEAKMADVKQKDPAYKIDKMEAEVKKWKAKLPAAGATPVVPDNSNLSPQQKSIKAEKLVRKLFRETNIGFSSFEIPVMDMRIKEYSALVDEYLALNTKLNDHDIKANKIIIQGFVYQTNKDISGMEAANAAATDPNFAGNSFYLAKYHQAFWDAAKRIFSEEQDYADEYKVITDFVNRQGSLEDLKAHRQKNNEAEVKARKLPQTTVKDTKLEKILTDGFNAKYGEKATALKAVLVQNGWTTLRNNISGVVTGRERSAKLAYKGKDGKCYLLDDYIFIHEEYIGSSFTNTKAVFNGLFGSEMLCENVK